ncbi:nucleotidyl transferase [Methylosinus sp. R-45379]|uniref:glycosyltransferase family 2 protein n=1 Tax=Methylosinus sp. R-45379 TaxID=980563 RepID=UPI0007C88B12|nr:glycosyltransferase family 2 protein [Methylosinus sp. R-45379]OAI30938.1 nucleotidyl transferase [Methylosinus sp. R-45379]
MNSKLQILIPLAGESIFFDPSEYHFPKPLIDIDGETMIEHVLAPLKRAAPDARFIFLVCRDDVVKFSLDSILRLRAGENAEVISLATPTKGALCTCLLAVDALDMGEPLLVCNGDQVLDVDIAALLANFEASSGAAGVVTFRSVHPRWSYVRLDDNGEVVQAAEKSVISEHAIAGLYYFRKAQDFIDAAMATIAADDKVGEQFFIAPSLNQLILMNKRVVNIPVPSTAYYSFYSPQKVKDFVDLRLRSRRSGAAVPRVTVVVPAAGEGSRFAKSGWARPKPFIDVAGRPMIEHVLQNVKLTDSKTVVLVRKEHTYGQDSIINRLSEQSEIVSVDRLTEGTLCTIMLARRLFNDEDSILVANSDQVVDFSVDAYVRDCIDRNLDGSILVFQDTACDPKWSFARLDASGLVLEVAEKKPISNLATVGIYFFRRARDLINATIDMFVENDRINNEFYTCPVYNHMIRSGARIGVYEIPAAAMHGLGTPSDLQTYLKNIGAPASADAPS